MLPTWKQLGQYIDGEAAGDTSGNSVALSSDGNTVAIGAYKNTGNAGHVRIFSRNGTTWKQLGQDIDGEAAGDESGISVALSSDGKTVAIGAWGNDGYKGHVRIYRWNDTTWKQLGQDIDGEAANDESGWSVALSSDGKTVAIGANGHDGAKGHVRIYRWNDTTWKQLGQDIDGEAAGDFSGNSVALSSDGNTVAIGASGHDVYKGHVRIFRRNGTTWKQLGQDIDGEAAGDYSGMSVALSSDGKTVAIGAYKNTGNAGHVRIFRWNDTTWIQLGQDIDGEAANDESGWSVALSSDGKTVAIGAWKNDGNGADAGHVRIFRWNGTTWKQLGQDIDGEAAGDQSGVSVALSSDGKTVAIGAWGNDGNGADAGHVRIFRWNEENEVSVQVIMGEGVWCEALVKDQKKKYSEVMINANKLLTYGREVLAGLNIKNPANAQEG